MVYGGGGGEWEHERVKDWEDVLFGSCASERFTVGKCACVYVCVWSGLANSEN